MLLQYYTLTIPRKDTKIFVSNKPNTEDDDDDDDHNVMAVTMIVMGCDNADDIMALTVILKSVMILSCRVSDSYVGVGDDDIIMAVKVKIMVVILMMTLVWM